MSNVVILVPRREGEADRDRLWSFARARWANDHPEYRIVEGHHTADEGPFNRSRAINRAARAAGDWDVAVIIDGDVVVAPEQVWNAVAVAAATDRPVLAYDVRVHLSKPGTKKVLEGYRGNWRAGGLEKKELRDSCSSAIVVSRHLWDQVGGFDETFVGWGWEDVAFRCACETVANGELIKLAGELFHLWHRVSSGNNRAEATFRANNARGDRYVAARFDQAATAVLLAEAQAAAEQPTDLAPATGGWRAGCAPGAAELIPRVIHRTVPAGDDDPEVAAWWATVAEHHPAHLGWQLRTWRDPLDPADFPLTADLWPRCGSGAQLAGLVRLELLWHHGGIYLDSDVEVYRSCAPLLGLQGFAGWEDPKVVPDAVLGARPEHPAVALMLERARAHLLAGGDPWRTGPGVTTEVLPGRQDWLLFPPGTWYPYHYREQHRRGEPHAELQPWALGAHHWRGSWLTDRQREAIGAQP